MKTLIPPKPRLIPLSERATTRISAVQPKSERPYARPSKRPAPHAPAPKPAPTQPKIEYRDKRGEWVVYPYELHSKADFQRAWNHLANVYGAVRKLGKR